MFLLLKLTRVLKTQAREHLVAPDDRYALWQVDEDGDHVVLG
jgi:hypothetical protein